MKVLEFKKTKSFLNKGTKHKVKIVFQKCNCEKKKGKNFKWLLRYSI